MAGRELQPIKIREGSIRDLIALYERTYAKIVKEIVDAADSGKIQKARVMARINKELALLGVDINEWIKKEIPQYYLDGANIAVQDLRALGVDLSRTANFAVINQEAIKALLDETALNFAMSMTGISRNASTLLSNALKQQLNYIIAEGKLTGETRRMIAGNIKAKLEEQGLSALRDRAGKNWTFDRYADMLTRTKAVEARNQGLTNRMLGYGYDLVQVTNHHTICDLCSPFEGKILSLTGRTPPGTKLPGGFTVLCSLDKAKERGLFHPNCKHAINVLVPELAAKTKAYDNPYNKLSREDQAAADAAWRNRNADKGQWL